MSRWFENSESRDMSSYITAANYHSNGVQRIARLAPQVEFLNSNEQRSAIPRTLVYVPPNTNTEMGYFPSHLNNALNDDRFCIADDFYNGRCSS